LELGIKIATGLEMLEDLGLCIAQRGGTLACAVHELRSQSHKAVLSFLVSSQMDLVSFFF
jgi:hypothetical protein